MIADPALGGVRRVHATLPIFRLSGAGGAVFYAPGHARLVPLEHADQVEGTLASGAAAGNPESDVVARLLEGYGRAASQAWRDLTERPFEPECLTLVLSNRCELSCRYCYSADNRTDGERAPGVAHALALAMPESRRAGKTLSEPIAEQAMRLVARSCASASRPFTLVFQGGGEPTFEWQLLVRLHATAIRVARDLGTRVWTHIATHGAIDERRARWLAEHLDDIGLSCDGPPDIQDAQRRSPRGPTSALVERTASLLKGGRADVTVRATVTPATVGRQSEIVDYVHAQLGVRRIRIEPVHRGRNAGGCHFIPDDAEGFVRQYMLAAEAARDRGCELHTSGARPEDIHGPYCNPLRNVIQVRPDGFVTACFLDGADRAGGDGRLLMGRLDERSGELVVDGRRVDEVRQHAAAVTDRCGACINVYHCARGCPDVCLATNGDRGAEQESFRCRVQRGLAIWRIREMALEQVQR